VRSLHGNLIREQCWALLHKAWTARPRKVACNFVVARPQPYIHFGKETRGRRHTGLVEQPQKGFPGGTLEILAAMSQRPEIPNFYIKVMSEYHDLSDWHRRQRCIRLRTPQPCPAWEKGGAFDALGDRNNPIRVS